MLDNEARRELATEIERQWGLFLTTRALSPFAVGDNPVVDYVSPGYYQARGRAFLVRSAEPIDPQQMRDVGAYLNTSFIVILAAILEQWGVAPSEVSKRPSSPRPGELHVLLTRWLRNQLLHKGTATPKELKHSAQTVELFRDLFPELPVPEDAHASVLPTSVDTVLEPLKEGVLLFVRHA